MITRSPDTHPEIEKIQISLLRKASVAKRLSRMRSLSESMIRLSRRAIQRANPDFSEREVNLAFLEYSYGHELAVSVGEYLKKREL